MQAGMASVSNHLRQLAGGIAVAALVFNSMSASAEGLYQNPAAVNKYRPALSETVARVAGDDLARGDARGFMFHLEAALKQPAEKPVIVAFPQQSSTNQLFIAGVAPPKGFDSADIPVCAEQNNRVLGTWKITPKGDVVTDTWNGATTGEKLADGRTKPACNAYIIARRNEMAQMAAQRLGQAPAAPKP